MYPSTRPPVSRSETPHPSKGKRPLNFSKKRTAARAFVEEEADASDRDSDDSMEDLDEYDLDDPFINDEESEPEEVEETDEVNWEYEDL